MRFIFVFCFLCVSAWGFSQNTGLIVGKITDETLNNSPLVLASVSIKGTEIKASTDQTGLFVIENLNAGNYTLVCSFLGYESKEVNVQVDALNPLELKLSLAASTISIDDLAAITSIAQKEETDSSSKALN